MEHYNTGKPAGIRETQNEQDDRETNNKAKIERDYEPEQAYGTAHDFKEHTRFGGTREDY